MRVSRLFPLLTALLLWGAFTLPTFAQSFTVSSTSVFNGSSTSTKLTTGQACFTPSAGGGTTCFTVTNGVFSGSMATNTYNLSITNSNTGQTILILTGIPITANWVFDTYQVPVNTTGIPTYSGTGQPYLQCAAASYYLRTDPPNPLFATYTCGTIGQYTQWYLAPFNPSSQLDALNRNATQAFVYGQFKPINLPALFAGLCTVGQYYQPFPNSCTDKITDKGGQVFNVKAYGAVGNGVVDDHAAFEAAIAAAAAVGSQAYCPAATYAISTIALTSAMSNSGLIGPVRSQNSSKTCSLKALGSGSVISNAGDNPGASHPALSNFRVSNVAFNGNATSYTAIEMDDWILPEIDHITATNFAACAVDGSGIPIEPCSHILKIGTSLYCNIHDNVFTGHGYAIDAQWAYTTRTLAGSYGCNDIDFLNNNFSSDLGVRVSGDVTVDRNDFEMSLQLPAKAQLDFSDTTVGAITFFASVKGNYSESSTQYHDAAHPTYQDNVLIRCSAPCNGLAVTDNKRLYGNNFLPGSKAIWLDSNLYALDIEGNSFQFWETPILMTTGKTFLTNSGGVIRVGGNFYGPVPTPAAVQPTLTLTLTGGALTNIAFAGGTAGAYQAAPQVIFTGGNCTVTPVAVGVTTAGSITSYSITRAGSGCDGTLAATSAGGIVTTDISGTQFTSPIINTTTAKHINMGVEWKDDTGFHFDNRATTFGSYILTTSDTSIDLQLANLYELTSGSLTINSVTNTRSGQKFSIRNRGGTLTLTNATFNLCTGADFSIPVGATLIFGVGTAGTVREEACGSKALSASSGSGTVASVAASTTSTTTTLGPTTFYTTANDGITHTYRYCQPLVVTVAGTGTYTPIAAFTYAAHSFTINATGSLNVNTQWVTNFSQISACITFPADPNTAIKWEIFASSITGPPTLAYSVTLELLQ